MPEQPDRTPAEQQQAEIKDLPIDGSANPSAAADVNGGATISGPTIDPCWRSLKIDPCWRSLKSNTP